MKFSWLARWVSSRTRALVSSEIGSSVQRMAEARKKAQSSGLLKFQDELADLRQNLDLTPLVTRLPTAGITAPSWYANGLVTLISAGARQPTMTL